MKHIMKHGHAQSRVLSVSNKVLCCCCSASVCTSPYTCNPPCTRTPPSDCEMHINTHCIINYVGCIIYRSADASTLTSMITGTNSKPCSSGFVWICNHHSIATRCARTNHHNTVTTIPPHTPTSSPEIQKALSMERRVLPQSPGPHHLHWDMVALHN